MNRKILFWPLAAVAYPVTVYVFQGDECRAAQTIGDEGQTLNIALTEGSYTNPRTPYAFSLLLYYIWCHLSHPNLILLKVRYLCSSVAPT